MLNRSSQRALHIEDSAALNTNLSDILEGVFQKKLYLASLIGRLSQLFAH